MRTETKEIKWYHYPEEVPQCECAEVLVRAKNKVATRMGYYLLMWFNSKDNPAFANIGFVYEGEPIGRMRHLTSNNEYYPFNEFEWCYLTEDDRENDRLISIF